MPSLRHRIERLSEEAGAERVAVAYYDYSRRKGFSYRGDERFHAASTIKVAVLLALFDRIRQGEFALGDRLHVRNRFVSVADGSVFQVSAERDANAEVQAAVGKTMKLRALAHGMIVTSSNLATNLLVELVGVAHAEELLARWGVEGVALRRGVEDEAAFEAGIINEVTAEGLVALFRILMDGRRFPKQLRERMLEILFDQRFRSGIPAGLPDSASVAHKTGEISTVAHDAGLVFLPDRKPYALTILTAWKPEAKGRSDLIASLSEAVYQHLTGVREDG